MPPLPRRQALTSDGEQCPVSTPPHPTPHRWRGEAAQLQQLLPLEARLTTPWGAETAVGLRPMREGCYLGTYTPDAPGYHRLHVCTQGGAPLPRTPFSVVVVAAAAADDPPGVQGVGAGAGPGAGPTAAAAAEAPGSGGGSDGGAGSPDRAHEVVVGQQMQQQPEAQGHHQQQEVEPESPTTGAGPGQLPAPPPPPATVPDLMRVWERIAEAAFAADGSREGWDSDGERHQGQGSSEEQYIKVRGCGGSWGLLMFV